MGRTLPTFRQLIDQTQQRWRKFRRALRREDQLVFDRLWERVRYYAASGTYAAAENPTETLLLAMLLDQQKAIEELQRRLGEPSHANHRLAFRPLSLPAGDDAVADRQPEEPPPPD